MSGKHQLGPFEVGQVKAHLEHGLGCTKIAQRVFKADGKTPFGETAISNCIAKLREDPNWRGEREEGSGAPRKTTERQDKAIVKWVLDQRGEVKVTVHALKKEFLFLRKLGNSLVEERLHDAELWYLRRRSTSIVTKEYLPQRVAYCRGVKRKHDTTLEKWAYTDGTVFYIDRTEEEHQNTRRRALGTHVWRKSENRDAMFQDCLGPSAYNKGQGLPVRIWGMLACGGLYIHVLEEGEAMNTELYVELIEDKFVDWVGNCEYLVCDFEKCLRSQPALFALDKINLKLVDGYPKCSQDFNAIENAWKTLKDRLNETMPRELESREDFIPRLHAAVAWMNRHRKEQLWRLSTNQKERADACLKQDPPGGRTEF
jgi:transposase